MFSFYDLEWLEFENFVNLKIMSQNLKSTLFSCVLFRKQKQNVYLQSCLSKSPNIGTSSLSFPRFDYCTNSAMLNSNNYPISLITGKYV